MTETQDQWGIFWGWEFRLNLECDPKHCMIDLRPVLRQEWEHIRDKKEYIRLLQGLENSTRDVASQAKRVRLCRRLIDDKRARSSRWHSGSVAVGAYQELKDAIQKHLDSLRVHVETIREFSYEQHQLNTIGKPNGNERSRKHTGKLLKETISLISKTESKLDECRQLLAKRGVSHTPDSEDPGANPQDDGDGGNGSRQQETQHQTTGTHRGGSAGLLHDIVRQGNNRGLGAGAGAPGGNDGDGDKGARKPISKPDVIESDNQNEGMEHADEEDYIGFDHESTQEDGAGGSGEEHESSQARETARQLGRAGHARSAGRSEGSLRDYSYFERGSPFLPAHGARFQQTSQIAGANQVVTKGNGQDHTSRAPHQTRMRRRKPDHPNDDSSSSGSRKTSKPARGRKERKSKRSESDDGDSGVDSSPRRSKRKRTAPDAGASQEAMIETLPGPVQEYYLRATGPESTLILDKQFIAAFVLRLYRAFGDLHHWVIERPIRDYLTENGGERPGEAIDILRRAEFDQGWANFFNKLPAKHEALRPTYEDIRTRLDALKALILPPKPEDDAARLLGWYRMRIIEAENPEMHSAWMRYATMVGGKKGLAAQQMARDAYETMLKRVRDDGNHPYLPPPQSQSPVALRTSDRPLPEHALHDPKRVTKEAQRLGFVVNDIPGSWTFLSTLNVGGFGHAGLWVKYDSSGKIVDRKVAKETYLGSYWDEELYWKPTEGDRVPREFWIGTTLASCDQAYNIIGPICYAVYPESRMHRLYMDYCACGDLEDLIQNHRALAKSKAKDEEGNKINCLIPISVIWCIFEALASAACLMRDGCLVGDNPPDAWASIFHRDMKPRNVFLDSPDSSVWRSIPVPKLGDFGLALERNPGNVEDPSTDSVDVGTPGYRAPEAEVYDSGMGVPSYRYSSASDIFVIGRIMLSLVNLQPGNHVQQYRFDGPDDVPSAKDAAKAFYPKPLLDLVHACMRAEPENRITADELYLDIKKQVTTSEGLRDIPLKFGLLGEGEVLHFKPDAYAAWAK